MKEIIQKIEIIAVDIDRLIKEGESGYSENSNATGDVQLKLDVQSDKIIEEHFATMPQIKAIISEEKEEKKSN